MGELVKQDIEGYLVNLTNINSTIISPVIVLAQAVSILKPCICRGFNFDNDSKKNFDALKTNIGKTLQKLSQPNDPVALKMSEDDLEWLQVIQNIFKDIDATHKDSMDDETKTNFCVEIKHTKDKIVKKDKSCKSVVYVPTMKRKFPSENKIQKKSKLADLLKEDSEKSCVDVKMKDTKKKCRKVLKKTCRIEPSRRAGKI